MSTVTRLDLGLEPGDGSIFPQRLVADTLRGLVRPEIPTQGLGWDRGFEDNSVMSGSCPASGSVLGGDLALQLISPTCQPSQAGTWGLRLSLRRARLRGASVQGPGLPSLLGTFRQGAVFPPAKHLQVDWALLYDRYPEICKDRTHSINIY